MKEMEIMKKIKRLTDLELKIVGMLIVVTLVVLMFHVQSYVNSRFVPSTNWFPNLYTFCDMKGVVYDIQ